MSDVLLAEPRDLRELSAAELLQVTRDRLRARRLGEVEDLLVLSAWAALHSADPTLEPDGQRNKRVGHVLKQVGGDGTPMVQDFCLGEIAMARHTGFWSCRSAVADVLDLQHRLPLTWQVCRRGDCDIWTARRVAKMTRHLTADRVWVVDQAVARLIAHEPDGKTLAVAEAKIIEADPALHAARVEEEEQRRFVAMSRTDQFGLRMVIARLQAGDAAVLWALVELIADILTTRLLDHAGGHGQPPTRDELRSIAFGYVVRPAQALRLILEHMASTSSTTNDSSATSTDDAAHRGDEELCSAIAFPADLLETLKAIDWKHWAPQTTLYVHLHQGAVDGTTPDSVARVEGLGPMGLSQLRDLLGGTHPAQITVKPVIDLSDRVRTTAYEHPESLKERVHLITGGDYWPYATSTSRKVDYDHPTPFTIPIDDTGPPGQTGTHNSGPLARTHHRWKTHGHYRARQSGLGRYVITTPHGLAYLRDHHGTRPIPLDDARQIIDAPPTVDVYLPDVTVEIDLEDLSSGRRTEPEPLQRPGVPAADQGS